MTQFGITKSAAMTAAQALEAAVRLLRSKGHRVGEVELLDDGDTDLVALIDADVEIPCWLAGEGISLEAELP